MNVVFNTSPLIFLSRLELLEKFLVNPEKYYAPEAVFAEIQAKEDQVSQSLSALFRQQTIHLQSLRSHTLAQSLCRTLGKGEAEAISLGLDIQADYVILDDFAARREASRLGLPVKGTLAIIKKLQQSGQTDFESLDHLYESLVAVKFRVKRSIFDQIFKEA